MSVPLFHIDNINKDIFIEFENKTGDQVIQKIVSCQTEDLAKQYIHTLKSFILEKYLEAGNIDNVIFNYFTPPKRYPPYVLSHPFDYDDVEYETENPLDIDFLKQTCEFDIYVLDLKEIKGKWCIVFSVPCLKDNIILASSFNKNRLEICFDKIQTYIQTEKDKGKKSVNLFYNFKKHKKKIFDYMCPDIDIYDRIIFPNIYDLYIKQEATYNFVLYLNVITNKTVINIASSLDYTELQKLFSCLINYLKTSFQFKISTETVIDSFSIFNRNKTLKAYCPTINFRKIN